MQKGMKYMEMVMIVMKDFLKYSQLLLDTFHLGFCTHAD